MTKAYETIKAGLEEAIDYVQTQMTKEERKNLANRLKKADHKNGILRFTIGMNGGCIIASDPETIKLLCDLYNNRAKLAAFLENGGPLGKEI